MSKTIRVTCEAKTYLPLDSLVYFQGELCTLEKNELEVARKTLLEDGIFKPALIWQHKGKNNIIDFHARYRVLIQMVEEGYTIETIEGVENPIPASLATNIKTVKQAKELVLKSRTRFHRMSDESLYEYMHLNEIPWENVKEAWAFPGMNRDIFELAYVRDGVVNYDPESKQREYDEDIKTKSKCPRCGYEWG